MQFEEHKEVLRKSLGGTKIIHRTGQLPKGQGSANWKELRASFRRIELLQF